MSKKVLLMASVLVIVFAFGATSVLAEDDETEACPPVYSEEYDTWVSAYYCDGRLNAFDMMQPVAIYYTYDTAQVLDDDGNWTWTDVVTGIALWSVDADSNGQLALWVPKADIVSAFSAASDVQIATAHGIALNYSPSAAALWVTAPGYTFAWEPW